MRNLKNSWFQPNNQIQSAEQSSPKMKMPFDDAPLADGEEPTVEVLATVKQQDNPLTMNMFIDLLREDRPGLVVASLPTEESAFSTISFRIYSLTIRGPIDQIMELLAKLDEHDEFGTDIRLRGFRIDSNVLRGQQELAHRGRSTSSK